MLLFFLIMIMGYDYEDDDHHHHFDLYSDHDDNIAAAAHIADHHDCDYDHDYYEGEELVKIDFLSMGDDNWF